MSRLYIVDCRISKQDLYKMTLSRPFASGWIMYQFVHIRGASCRCTQSKNEHNKSKHFYSKPISTLSKIAFRMSACINYIDSTATVQLTIYLSCCLFNCNYLIYIYNISISFTKSEWRPLWGKNCATSTNLQIGLRNLAVLKCGASLKWSKKSSLST